ncbi:adenosine deaminase [Demequina sp. TTPB684]|uniref:adenosine deaminase n=1 Tax=unclassified Demequina TaxID=2620311 RepID=UPI001CF1693F|nr:MULTISPECIES: adenosine deaminase [unclassified Demequina]MCB2411841.1 adenosine deaminase [Demequina sp. TTPB684]UPU87260.1 adenosine deaminase [Demequina sp. TMPB413]
MTLTTPEILALPKILLHDHLDGGLRPSTLIELAGEIGHELPSTDPDELQRLFVENANSGDLVRYLEAFAHTTAVMQTAQNLTRIAREAVVDLANDGVVYAELRYAPEQHVAGGLSLQEVVEAVQSGIEEGIAEAAEAGRGIRAAALLDAMRHLDRSYEIAELAIANRGRCCVGFDIAGPEFGFPPSKHREAFQLLRENHMPVTIHAGEADGAASVGEALGLGSARRLGHGVRIHEDIENFGTDEEPVFGLIAQHALDEQIPLECSPTSNVQTAAATSIEDHPMHELRDLGFAVTINTDNRLVSGVSMSGEFEALVGAGWTKEDLFEATLVAAWGAFLPYHERADLADSIVEGFEG